MLQRIPLSIDQNSLLDCLLATVRNCLQSCWQERVRHSKIYVFSIYPHYLFTSANCLNSYFKYRRRSLNCARIAKHNSVKPFHDPITFYIIVVYNITEIV